MDGWWSEIDGDVRSCLERFGPMSPRDLARQLDLSEGAVSSVLSGSVVVALAVARLVTAASFPGPVYEGFNRTVTA